LNGITSISNFVKIYQAFQKLLVEDIHTDRQTVDLVNLVSFLESRLKWKYIYRHALYRPRYVTIGKLAANKDTKI
jgi:hypothetical protein